MKPTRAFSPPGTYFITSSTLAKRSIFQVDNMARLFLHVLYSYERQGHYLLHEFLLMPDHFHIILTPARDTTLERGGQVATTSRNSEQRNRARLKAMPWVNPRRSLFQFDLSEPTISVTYRTLRLTRLRSFP